MELMTVVMMEMMTVALMAALMVVTKVVMMVVMMVVLKVEMMALVMVVVKAETMAVTLVLNNPKRMFSQRDHFSMCMLECHLYLGMKYNRICLWHFGTYQADIYHNWYYQ